jgi:hypothetical protein
MVRILGLSVENQSSKSLVLLAQCVDGFVLPAMTWCSVRELVTLLYSVVYLFASVDTPSFFACRYYCDYCDTYLTHDSVSVSFYPLSVNATQ